ncbi:SusD family protein [Chitinophaga ginsengisegetis]|uniref:SusD family protein n=1 Tax=Chitinophaga ginsengisegetis TaxID=393003 RepID=A0A1T5N5B0_9BACT|nr:RagB/SusD family nutrient uptake outer membrane protein [Chitinophaga ginsengisegetis]SKC95636.1 SusD family protein [Chitinophaga ginsengisegetis]
MKKQFFLYSLLICTVAVLTVSCNKFLDVIPKGKQVASTITDYELLMNSPDFYNYLQGGGWQVPLLMGDEIAAEENYYANAYPYVQRLFRWDDVIYEESDVASDLRSFLSNLYTCNKVINEVMNADGGTSLEKQYIQAEAKATRAWIYFQLINFYAKPYQASTATTDPGFPIITTADVMQNSFSRSTVQAVYDFMIADLNAAIAVLPLRSKVKSRMSGAAAAAILGKIYLFMGKSVDALPLFNTAIDDANASPIQTRLYDYNKELAPGGSFLPIGMSGPNSDYVNLNDYTESVLAKTFSNQFASGGMGIIIKPETAALFGPTDLRLLFYSADYPDWSPNPSGRLRRYGVMYSRFGVTLAELYLLRAECKARMDDLTGACGDMEMLRKHRMPEADAPVPSATATDKFALIKFIFDERIREFAAEGYRWFDMRRLSVDPLFPKQTFTHSVYLQNGSTQTYTLRQPDRLTLRIPSNIMVVNPGLENNP